MISDQALPPIGVMCGIDDKLSALRREIKFIARTLARLRHRHHAAVVFSSPQLPLQPPPLLSELREQSLQTCTSVLRKLFAAPHKERLDDIESAPASPVHDHGPALPPPGSRLPTPPPTRPSSVPPRPRPAPQCAAKRWSCPPAMTHDTVTVIVDAESHAIFEVPRRYIADLVRTRPPEDVYISAAHGGGGGGGADGASPVHGIYLPKVRAGHFYDFVRWTRTRRILPYEHHGVECYIEHQARQLIDALALGVQLGAADFHAAATADLCALGPWLPWPEDFVNAVFAATKAWPHGVHPARHLIVAVVAAKTCGRGKRRVRQGPRDKHVERGDRISSTTFWRMYDAYCAESGPECEYPANVAALGL